MCHILLVLPFVSLILFLVLPFDEALVLYSLILAFCSVFYWLIWKAMRRPVATGVEGMIGGTGHVMEYRKGAAKVVFKGEIWDAICRDDLSSGDSVVVTGLERLKLIVRKHERRV